MTVHSSADVTPHQHAVDLRRLEGREVLGESLAVLFSAALRLEPGTPEHGVATSNATWPTHEAEALKRAMERVEPDALGDGRTPTERDGDRFLAVLLQVLASASEILLRRPSASS